MSYWVSLSFYEGKPSYDRSSDGVRTDSALVLGQSESYGTLIIPGAAPLDMPFSTDVCFLLQSAAATLAFMRADAHDGGRILLHWNHKFWFSNIHFSFGLR
jgi:hypothetical protein